MRSQIVSRWDDGAFLNNFWEAGANWDNGIPNGIGDSAIFGNDPGGAGFEEVILGSNKRVGALTFEGDEHSYGIRSTFLNTDPRRLNFEETGGGNANVSVTGNQEHVIGFVPDAEQGIFIRLFDDLLIENNSTATNGLTIGTLSDDQEIRLRGFDLTVDGSSRTTIHSLIRNGQAGSNSVTKNGSGILRLTDPGNVFSGGVVLNDGTIEIGSNAALGSGDFTINGGSVEAFGAARTISNDYTINDDYSVEGTNDLTFSGEGTLAAGAQQITVADPSVTHTLSGTLSGAGGLVKEGDGTLAFSGGSKTFTGDIVVNEGTLLLGSNDQIGNSTNMVLAGGTFNTNNFDEVLGTLTLNADSTIDFGDTPGDGSILQFADSSAVPWDPGATLTIINWEGIVGTGNGIDQLFFGSDGNGLSPTQRSQIVFADFPGDETIQLADGEVVPVPEPAAIAATLGLAALIGWRERKRIAQISLRIRDFKKDQL
ncbi:MAG: autotransporter-associated beta strand repeat-containing protein [Verrucomicrobiota bacterium]